MLQYYKDKVSATNSKKIGSKEAQKDLLPTYYVKSDLFEWIFGGNTIEVGASYQSFVMKLNSIGEIQWTTYIADSMNYSKNFINIKINTNDEIIIAGSTEKGSNF